MSRPFRNQAIEGATQMGWGTALLCFAASSSAFVLLPETSAWRNVIGWLLLACAALAPYGAQQAIKRSMAGPRTNDAAHRRNPKSFWIAIIVSGVVAAALGVALPFLLVSGGHYYGPDTPNATGASAGTLARLLFAACFAVPNAVLFWMSAIGSIKEHRWKRFALLLVGLGPFAVGMMAPPGFVEMSRPVMLYLGLVWLVSGGATLGSYVRETAPPSPSAG